MPTERSSQTAEPATREKKNKFIDAKCALTGSAKTMCMAGGSADVHDSIRAAHPIFLRLHIELITDPGQRMDGFGQHWTCVRNAAVHRLSSHHR